jgi:hypothetical protein
MLPKLALGIIMVPFTWWIVSFVTSLGSILATSVMQIPMESLQVIKPTDGQ